MKCIKNYKKLRAIKKRKLDPVRQRRIKDKINKRKWNEAIRLHVEKLRAEAKQGDINNLKDYTKYLEELKKNKNCVVISTIEGKKVLSYNDLKVVNIADLRIKRLEFELVYYCSNVTDNFIVRPCGKRSEEDDDFEYDSACLQYHYILETPFVRVRFHKEENAEKLLKMFVDFIISKNACGFCN